LVELVHLHRLLIRRVFQGAQILLRRPKILASDQGIGKDDCDQFPPELLAKTVLNSINDFFHNRGVCREYAKQKLKIASQLIDRPYVLVGEKLLQKILPRTVAERIERQEKVINRIAEGVWIYERASSDDALLAQAVQDVLYRVLAIPAESRYLRHSSAGVDLHDAQHPAHSLGQFHHCYEHNGGFSSAKARSRHHSISTYNTWGGNNFLMPIA